jgi:tetratricopeptide (TPR) repeat protein
MFCAKHGADAMVMFNTEKCPVCVQAEIPVFTRTHVMESLGLKNLEDVDQALIELNQFRNLGGVLVLEMQRNIVEDLGGFARIESDLKALDKLGGLEEIKDKLAFANSVEFKSSLAMDVLELKTREELEKALFELRNYRNIQPDIETLENQLNLLNKYENLGDFEELEDTLKIAEKLGDLEEVQNKLDTLEEFESSLRDALKFINRGLERMPDIGDIY